MTWWISDGWQHNRVLLVSWIVWIVVSIVLHELGHGWAALRAGDRTPLETGHMTWNPLVHIPPMSWLMFAICGICWGLMPVNPSRFRGRYDSAVVAAAGPAMNLGLGVILAVGAALWMGHGHRIANPTLYANLAEFLVVGVGLNFVLTLFNLMPVPPLDGSRIAANFIPAYDRFVNDPRGAIASLIGFLLLFRYLSAPVMVLGMRLAGRVVVLVTHALGPLAGSGPP